MPGQTLSLFDAALKDVYTDRIEEQLNNKNPLTEFIDENDSATWTGRQVVGSIRVGRNQGVGASGEGDPLPEAGYQQYAQVKIPEKYSYGRVRLTAQVIEDSLKSQGAFERAMESEIGGLVRDLANERERALFGYGNGVLCHVASSSTNTLFVDNPGAVTGTINGARFLERGATYAILDPTTPTTIRSTFTVGSTISTTGGYVVATGAVTGAVDGDLVVRAKIVTGVDVTGNKNSYGYEPMGLLGLLDDGTYTNTLHNVNRTTYPIFKSYVLSSVGGLSLDVIQRGIDVADERGGGDFGQNGVFFTGYDTRREYLKLLQADRRYTGGDLRTPDGGTKKAALKSGGEITYGDRPWKVSKYAPYGLAFGFLKNSITRYINVRGEWANNDGRILRNVPNYDAWEAFYRIFDNYHTDRPNEGFRLDGITTSVAVYAR